MTLAVAKFTPEAMLQATRRSAAVPNASGTRALYSVSGVGVTGVEATKHHSMGTRETS